MTETVYSKYQITRSSDGLLLRPLDVLTEANDAQKNLSTPFANKVSNLEHRGPLPLHPSEDPNFLENDDPKDATEEQKGGALVRWQPGQ